MYERAQYDHQVVVGADFTFAGVIETSNACRVVHPSQFMQYTPLAIVWTFTEWETITALATQFRGPVTR